MNYSEIVEHLRTCGYSATLTTGEIKWLEVDCKIEDRTLKLVHLCVDEITRLPVFYLEECSTFGYLAHVLPIGVKGLGGICVNDQDSISVNYERPELAFEESLKSHTTLLEKVITDPDWNRHELLREFYANWLTLCDDSPDFLCAASGDPEPIEVYRPEKGRRWGLAAKYLGVTPSTDSLAGFSYIVRQKKGRDRAGEGFVIPLKRLEPAPQNKDDLADWYVNAIPYSELPNNFAQRRGRHFWLIFNADTPSGRSWFGVELNNKGKGKEPFPKTKAQLENWSIRPIKVKIFNQERLMPRSGADLSLADKSVLLVGCGSVGGEIAYKLGAAGLGNMKLVDPDVYTVDNIYRHVLMEHYLGCNKALSLSLSLDTKYPWIKTSFQEDRLLDLRLSDYLNRFDLIVIAIGSPTHERLFHDFLIEQGIHKPVINTWLEGYGIGGHAVLDIPGSPGCLRCAYVDLQTGHRGLSSNLNFMEQDQDVTVNYAGCGDLFLPYDASSAAQTALIATNLAVGILQGTLKSSSKISWKGDLSFVDLRGFSVTHRHMAFDKSLQILPLFNDECDLCHEP